MKRLSKAQENVLARIKESYDAKLEDDKKYYTEAIENHDSPRYKGLPLEYYQEHLEMANKGYILWHSTNSKTLEILAQHGLIEYIKKDGFRNIYPVDYVKLINN